MAGKSERQKALRKGRFAEYIAALWLLIKGYRISAMRYRTKLGEIDIIARKGALAIFVEVKARRDTQSGIDAVSRQSQLRIRAASDIWLSKQRRPDAISQRYDIIVISPSKWPRHFLDAF